MGSAVCGSGEFIAEARRSRKVLGGGMRQAGIIAAAGIVAMEKMVKRLKEDHANAMRLAEGIDQIEGLSIDLTVVQTNIIYFDMVNDKLDIDTFVKRLEKKGVRLLHIGGPRRCRVVTHYGIEAKDIDVTLAAMRKVIEES